MLPPASKRLRLDREPPTKAVLPVATQLARWWRDKQRDPETFMDPELAPLLPSSRSRFGGATDFSGGGGSDFAGGGGRNTDHRPPAPSDNPHTTLLRLGRTKAARQMLAGLAAQHSAQLAQGADANGAERQKQLHVALSACFLWLGDSGKAVQQLMQLRESFGRLSDHQSLLLHLAGCQHSNGSGSPGLDGRNSNTRAVPVHPVDDLSFSEFRREFSNTAESTGLPVVIKGGADRMVGGADKRWSLAFLKEVAGKKPVQPKRKVDDSAAWARLEPCAEVTLGDFIDGLPSPSSESDTGKGGRDYVFDWPLPVHSPELLKDLTILRFLLRATNASQIGLYNKGRLMSQLGGNRVSLSHIDWSRYFSGDLFQRTPHGSLYRDSWPSLFVGPPGSACSLHIDANATHFWMALFGEGTKEWLLFPPDQTHLLHPFWPPFGATTRDPIFHIDPFAPWADQLRKYPSLAGTTPYRVVLKPGDVLFVPCGWAHAVRNLPGPPTVALSANYVDGSNLEKFVAELKWQAIAEEEAAEISGGAAGRSAPVDEAAGRSAALLRAVGEGDFGAERGEPTEKAWGEFKRVV